MGNNVAHKMLEIIEKISASLIILGMLLVVMFLALGEIAPIEPPSIPDPTPTVETSPLTAEDFYFDDYISRLIYGWAAIMIISLIMTASGFKNILAVPNWAELKGLSSNEAFKLSYIGLFVIPLAVYVLKANFFGLQIRFEVPLNAKLSYFSALSFAVAAIIHAIAAPKASHTSEDNQLNSHDSNRLMLRWLCYAALMYGVLILLIVLYRTSIYIFFA
jgi:hypothetical protein